MGIGPQKTARVGLCNHRIGAAALVLLMSGRLDAVITQYVSRPAFTTAAGAVTTQNFNSFAGGANVFEGVAFDFGDFSALNGANTGSGGDIDSTGAVNGSTELVGSVAAGGATFVLAFDAPITALAFDADNLADQRNDTLSFNNTAGDVVAILDPVDQTRFWGFISDTPFTTLTLQHISGPTGTDGFSLDDLTYSTIPEPTALTLAPLGLVGWLMGKRGRPDRSSSPSRQAK